MPTAPPMMLVPVPKGDKVKEIDVVEAVTPSGAIVEEVVEVVEKKPKKPTKSKKPKKGTSC